MSDWRPLPGPFTAFTLGAGERIVFCHGFTQTSASWRPIAEMVADLGYESVVVDLPGHGGSSHLRADQRDTAELLTAMIGGASYVGYSMGGRLCLQVALSFPWLVRRLALIGASPGIDDEHERMRRVAGDTALAARIERIGVPAFLREWMVQPLFGAATPDPADVTLRETNTAAGLASSLRLSGTGVQPSSWDRLSELPMPVLVMAGERDAKYVEIGRALAAKAQDATFATIADADHAAHLRHPDQVFALLRPWLAIARP